MARPEKFSSKDLLIAVMEYSKVYPGPIVISKLAAWASETIPTLSGVKDIDFRRASRSKKGNNEDNRKACYVLIQKINQERTHNGASTLNVLLHASDVYEFLNMPQGDQIDTIIEARKYLNDLESTHQNLSKKERLLREENQSIKKKYAELSQRLDQLQIELEHIKNVYSLLEETIDEHRRRKVLSSLGIEETYLDPTKALQSMSLSLSETKSMFSFDRTTIANPKELNKLDIDNNDAGSMRNKILTGINFGENL